MLNGEWRPNHLVFPSSWTARLGFNEDWLNVGWLVSNYNIWWMNSTLELIYSYGFSPDWLLFPIRTCDLLLCHSTLEWPSFQYDGRKSLFRHQFNQNVFRVVNGLVWLTRLPFSASIRWRVLWVHISHACSSDLHVGLWPSAHVLAIWWIFTRPQGNSVCLLAFLVRGYSCGLVWWFSTPYQSFSSPLMGISIQNSKWSCKSQFFISWTHAVFPCVLHNSIITYENPTFLLEIFLVQRRMMFIHNLN